MITTASLEIYRAHFLSFSFSHRKFLGSGAETLFTYQLLTLLTYDDVSWPPPFFPSLHLYYIHNGCTALKSLCLSKPHGWKKEEA